MNDTIRKAITGLTCVGTIALASCGGGDGGALPVIPASVTVSVADISLSEGQSGKTAFAFVLSLSETHPETLTVDYATSDETAQDENGDGDYQSSAGTISFAPFTLSTTLTIEVNGDAAYELDETFQLTLSNPQGTNFSILQGSAKGRIVTDDFASNADVEVQAASFSEGDAGQAAFDFLVTLSAPLANEVTVQFTTSDGSAEDQGGDSDYQSATGFLTFAPGHTEQHLYVVVFGDTKVEADESFGVELSNVTGAGASLRTAQAAGTIRNEDAAEIFVSDVSTLETDFGSFELVFEIGLSAEHTQLVSVDFATNDGTASSNAFIADYVPQAGTLFFVPGTTELTVSVTGLGDFHPEGDEYLTLDLANESGPDVSILTAQAIGMLVDNDVDGRVDTDDTGGLSHRPQLAAADGRAYTVWFDERDGNADVYFSATDDAGETWLADDVRLDTDAPGAASSTGVQVCAEGANVYVVWQDDRNGTFDVYFNRSADHGQTWLADDVRLDSDAGGPSNSITPRIACANGVVHVVWTDDRDGLADVYYDRSGDGGSTWLASEARLDLDGVRVPGATESIGPQVVASGDQVHVAWIEDEDVYSNSSADGGLHWFASHVRVDHENGPTPDDAAGVQLAVQGTTVHVVWSDSRNGYADVFFQRSTDGGASFPGPDVRLDASDPIGFHHSLDAQLSVSGNHVYVVWRDERHGAGDPPNGEIYFNHSADGGLSWSGDRSVPTGLTPGKTDSTQPQVASDGERVYVIWSDDVNFATYDLFANVSFNGGQSWLIDAIRLDSDPAGSAHSTHADVVFDDERVLVVWEDARSALDIFFRALTFE